jgi:protocatechuate 3,4-dioxygenase beta subunit
VLLRNASVVRWKASIGNWLFGVAHRLAVQARANAARRRRRENEAGRARPETHSPLDLSWREAIGMLHEELDRLPDAYRLPLLLCCLDGKTREEAAQVLGCSAGSIKGRLERGREMLRARLLRRGLMLSGALLAALVDAPPATTAPPSALVHATLQAAMTGAYSRSIAVLIRGATSALFAGKVRLAAGLLLTVSLLAVSGSHALAPPETAPAPEKPAARPTQQAAKPAPEKTIVVRGRVLDPDGKPVKGARLYWPRVPKNEPRTTEDIENIEIAKRAKSDAEGHFHFELPRSDIHPDWLKNISLLAVADGYGVDGVELPKDDPSPEVMLRLVKDQPIEGRIVSTEGKPLAGVSVRIMGVGKTRQERLDDFLAAWKQKDPRATNKAFGQLSQQMFLSRHEKSSQAVTDKDGRFRLQGAGVERMVLVRLRAPGLTPAPLFVVNRAGFDPTAWNKAARDNIPPEARQSDHPPLLYGPKIEYVAAAGRRIEGTVREADSGKPVPGYRITIEIPNGFDINAVSDKEGKYKLLGVPKMKEYMLFAHPPAKSAWLPTAARGADAEGLRALQVDFTVARGIIVSGRVLDRSTGKGVRAGVRFAPLPGNKFFGRPGYDYYKYAQQEQTMTDVREAGRYQLAVMPGPGVLMTQVRELSETANGGQKLNPYKQAEFDAKDREHVKITESDDGNRPFLTALENHSEYLSFQNAVKYLDLAPDADTANCDLFMERGATRTIQIEDAEGKALTGTTVAGVTASEWDTFTIKEASCTIFALDPKKPRRLFFWHAERKLAGTLALRGDEKEPVVVRLGRARAVTGRLLDRDGQPLADADIFLNWSDPAGGQLYGGAQVRPRVRTGKDGRFRFEGIVPELKFKLGISRGETIFLGDPPIGVRRVKAGETLDLGDIRVKPAQ